MVEIVELPHTNIAPEFSAEKIEAAIRRAQAGKANYRQFVKEATEAGCVYYIVYLKGRKVCYCGRNGDIHVEPFPGGK